jgi:membrane fusion protein, multidrug efflux system
VREGDVVRAGQVLAEVDAREVSAQVRSAQAALALARATAERSDRLFRNGVITAPEHERDQAALAAAEATLEQLRTRLGFATVKAPMGGVITARLVEPGDVVQGQTRLFALADLTTLIARVRISELDVAGIQGGEAVDVTADAIPGATFRGTVRRVFPAADSATRMVPVEVALAGGAGRLKPGFSARVTFRLDERPSVLLAPVSAVHGTSAARAVFVVKGDVAQRREVRLGHMSGAQVEVLEGLAAGDQVVVAGADDLRDGGKVRVVRPVGSALGDGAAPKGTATNAGARP